MGIVTSPASGADSLAALGFDVSIGDPEANWRILVDDLNARGGVSGRTVVPVIVLIDAATTTPQQDFQAACTRLTQDEPVLAVASDLVFDATFADCLAAADTPAIYGGAGLPKDGRASRCW